MRDCLRRIRLGVVATLVIGGLCISPLSLRAETSASLAKIFSGDNAPATVSELRDMQEHLKKLSEKLIPCTVNVRVGQAQGSGVIISEDGYVLTAAHVVMKPNTDVTFVTHDGKQFKGKTLGMNRAIDAGLMKINEEGKKWPFLEMGKSNELKEGQWCVATGHPGGYERGRPPVVRFGRVLQNLDTVVTTDCTLVGGDSGGPLFDMEGRVIGINSRIAGPLNANMHVPVNTFRDTWERLVAAEAWGSTPGNAPFLGVQGEPEVKEAKVAKLTAGGPAEKGGLKIGDVIKEFNGKPIDQFSTLKGMVADKAPGDKIKLKIQRGEESLEIEITLAKAGG